MRRTRGARRNLLDIALLVVAGVAGCTGYGHSSSSLLPLAAPAVADAALQAAAPPPAPVPSRELRFLLAIQAALALGEQPPLPVPEAAYHLQARSGLPDGYSGPSYGDLCCPALPIRTLQDVRCVRLRIPGEKDAAYRRIASTVRSRSPPVATGLG